MRRAFYAGLFSAGFIWLAGCDGGDDVTFTPPPPALVRISSRNAETITYAVVRATRGAANLVDLGGAQLLPPAAALARIAAPAGGFAGLAELGPDTRDCVGGGTLTWSGNLADPDTLTPGDTLTLVFEACVDAQGNELDGQLDLEIVSVSGDLLGGLFEVRAAARFTALTLTAESLTQRADGEAALELDTASPPVTRAAVSGTRLVLLEGETRYELASFAVESTRNELLDTDTLSTTGTLTSSLYSGRAEFVTVVPFRSQGENLPDTGELVIAGADNATITVRPLDSQNVRLELDLDGNGSVDEIQDVSWADIGA